MDNRDIVKVLGSAVSLMELHDSDPRKAKSYSNAIFNLERLEKNLSDLTEDEILGINGVGPSIARSIHEIRTSGTLQLLEDLLAETPEGLIELLNIRGVGAGKIKTAWHELGVESPQQMLQVIDSGELGKLKGFGEKTLENIKASLEFYMDNRSRMLLPEALEISKEILDNLNVKFPGTLACTVGELRLMRPVIDEVRILVGSDGKLDLNSFPLFEMNDARSSPYSISGKWNEHPCRFFLTDKEGFELEKFRLTGSPEHFNTLRTAGHEISKLEPATFNETSFYEKEIGAEIGPERREGFGELQIPAKDLVTVNDLKGVLHCHSTYSDGGSTLREMAEACLGMGYEYLGIADHSKSAFFYANGMYENRVREQWEEIDKLNEELAPFRIFKGIESDILPDGNLDYDNEFLSGFDFVVASVHSVLNMTVEKATERLLTAIRNPYTTIMGHLTGRVLLQRRGYPLDHRAIIDACADHNVIIEINAHPSRLDLDWTWIPYAVEKGVMLSINPDAHTIDGMKDMEYGVWMSRKGGLPKSMNLNCMGIKDVEKYFSDRKQGK